MKKNLLLCFALAAGTLAAQSPSVSLVVPNANTLVPGNSPEAIPTTSTTVEVQVLLGSGQFFSSPITISGLSLRAAPGTGPVNDTISSISITLSTSPNFPNTNGGTLMSTTFAKNVGKDATLVFSGKNLIAKSAGCAGPGACPFDLNVSFTTPFTYSRTSGALLIDITETVNGTGTLDGVSYNAPGGPVATVVGAVGSATGTFSYGGSIFQLTYTTSAPMLTGVVNTASNIPPGPANYGLAQGSLFAVYGSNMGPSSLAVANLPLPTNGLSGTSITIAGTVGMVSAPVYFTRSDVVVGVMPSNTPPGNGTMIITYNGLSGFAPITVMQSNFGISNVVNPNANNGIGVLNTASVTFENYQPVTPTNTAKPGDTLTVWGTGLGATPNNGGDTTAPPAGNIGPAPQVFVGGIPSPSVQYWGRAPGTIPGLDQINFQVPPNAPLGCNVSIVVETMNGNTPVVSNGPTIALAATDGATCSDPTQFVPASDLSLSSAKVAYVGVQQNVSVNFNPNGTSTSITSSQGASYTFLGHSSPARDAGSVD